VERNYQEYYIGGKPMSKISPTMCAFPWMHLHAWPDGKAMLCCIAHGGEDMGSVGDFSTHTYEEIMNSDKMKQVRLDFMDGKRIPECTVCWKNEKLRKQSFRQNHLGKYNIESLLDNTLEDGSLKKVEMLYMDFRFSNLCNLGCQTCGSPLSSTIANNTKNKKEIEHLKRKNVLSDRETITSFVYARPDFMDVDVYPYIEDCEGFYFAGGEPLMHQEHLDILTYLDVNKLYSKEICYSTNMTLLKWKGNDFLKIWENFNNIMFWCSIDGHKEQLEYIREFSKHKNVFNNLKKLIKLKKDNPSKNFRVQICYTHSMYNAYYFKDFIEYLYEENILQDLDYFEINYAYGERNSPACLPDFAKQELLAKTEKAKTSKALQYAFKHIDDFEASYNRFDKLINEKHAVDTFDKAISEFLIDDIDKIETSLPWLYSVIKRHRIL
jgi:hypothetical protein